MTPLQPEQDQSLLLVYQVNIKSQLYIFWIYGDQNE
nr:MAG TPA: hypothetical protein [Caudoviricetes sp.]DAO77750.1 MAG TPA: hypothetical protein [Caudoviricetes sp.]